MVELGLQYRENASDRGAKGGKPGRQGLHGRWLGLYESKRPGSAAEPLTQSNAPFLPRL